MSVATNRINLVAYQPPFQSEVSTLVQHGGTRTRGMASAVR